MTQPIRVLHVLGTLNMGGAESRIMDLYRHMDRTKVQFDFLVHFAVPKQEVRPGQKQVLSSEYLLRIRPKDYFDEEVTSLGGRIYVLPRFTGLNLLEYQEAVHCFFARHHDFSVVEGHMTSTAAIYLPAAKKAGIPMTIAHARSAGIDPGLHGVATKLLRHNLAHDCDICLSCSRAASIAVFGQKAVEAGRVHVVPNALDVESFRFDEEKRRTIRKEYHIPDKAFVIGHVGRFDAMKNQAFLARVLGEIMSRWIGSTKDPRYTYPPIYCLFVGHGKLESEVRQAFVTQGLQAHAIFAGQCDREKTIAMYQAFDIFCFPSLYEGLPGTVIEAQAAGLPCLISDTITKEVCVTDQVRQLSIQNVTPWVEALQEISDYHPEQGIQDNLTKAAGTTGTTGTTGTIGTTGIAATETTESKDAARARIAARRQRSDHAIRQLDTAGYNISTAAIRMQNFYLRCAWK